MTEQERPLIDRVWEFTKDISVKVSRKAEKHWKINTLRVEIASIRHRINVKFKELGRYVYESVKSQTLEEESYKASLREFFDELKRLEGEILQRENRIEILETEIHESDEGTPPQPPPIPTDDHGTVDTEAGSEEDHSGDDTEDGEDQEASPDLDAAESKTPSEEGSDEVETSEPKAKTETKPKTTRKTTRKRTTRAKTSKTSKTTAKKPAAGDEEE